MAAISDRQRLLLDTERWSRLDRESQARFRGGTRGSDARWWGLTGRILGFHWPSIQRQQREIQGILAALPEAAEHEFPDVAVAAMGELMRLEHLRHGTATLMLTLTRPDRLLSVNKASASGLSRLSGESPSALKKPRGYGGLLSWLYDQPWYAAPRPENSKDAKVWRFRAALVDAFRVRSGKSKAAGEDSRMLQPSAGADSAGRARLPLARCMGVRTVFTVGHPMSLRDPSFLIRLSCRRRSCAPVAEEDSHSAPAPGNILPNGAGRGPPNPVAGGDARRLGTASRN